MKKTKISQRFLAALTLFFACTLSWAHDFYVDGIYYNISDDGTSVTVTCNGPFSNSYSGSVVIPSTVTYNDKKYSVTSIDGYAFRYCSSLTSVTIPNSVTSIYDDAFYNCSSLKSVTIPNSVTSIGDFVFFDCSSLTSVTIGNSVTTIGNHAFEYCKGLTSVTIPNSVTGIGEYAFSGCSGLTSITIPNSVTSIGDCAFFDCSSLTSVTIPNSVTSISRYAFKDCAKLTSITFPESLTDIDDHAFYGCSSLKSLTFPKNLTWVGDSAFSYCHSITEVRITGLEFKCHSNAFAGSFVIGGYVILKDRWLYVPAGCESKYCDDSRWKYFIVKGTPPGIGQTFTLKCNRGYVGSYQGRLIGTTDASNASVFTILKYNGQSYLFDTTTWQIVEHTTAAQAGLTGNQLTEYNSDTSKAVTGLKWGETETDSGEYPFYLEDNFGNWLNMDSNGNVCMNTWKDFEDGLGGNTYLVTIVNIDYDTSKAMTRLREYFTEQNISLNKTSAMLAKTGATVQLSATLEGANAGDAVTWRSSNPAVVTVSNSGLVTAVAKGNAYIYATSASGTTTEEPCHVIVNLADVSELSNTKQYYLHTYNFARGSLGFANGALATTYSAAQAHKCYSKYPFAIIKSGNLYYLYNIANSQFIDSNGDGTSSLTSDDAWTLTQNSNGLFMLKVAKTGKVLNVNWKEGIVINNWTTSDDGNQFVIEEAEDLDPTDALEKLSESHYSQTPVQSISELENKQVYTASTARASWYVPSGGTQMESTASPSAVSKTFTDSGQQFAFIKNEDKYYIYCVGEKKILNGITNNSPNRGMLVTEECQPVSITETGNADYPLFFSFGNNYNVNINGERNVSIDSWSTLDVGNRVALQPVWGVTLAEDELADILNCINTGISSISELSTDSGGICYDISGRRVSGIPGKGLYIVNGKKLMIK